MESKEPKVNSTKLFALTIVKRTGKGIQVKDVESWVLRGEWLVIRHGVKTTVFNRDSIELFNVMPQGTENIK